MELSWRIHSLNKDGSPKLHYNELPPVPHKDSDVIFETADSVDKPQNELSSPSISPDWLTSASTGEEHIAFPSDTLSPSPQNGDGTAMDFIDGDFADFDHILDWTHENNKPRDTPTDLVVSHDNGLHSSPEPAPTAAATQQDDSLARSFQPSETLEKPASPPLSACSCSGHLSALLFNLSGHLRRYYHSLFLGPPGGDSMQLGRSMSFMFAYHAGAARLGDDLMACGSQCMAQDSNTAQLVMLIEQLVDLYAGLMEQLPTVSYATEEHIDASVGMAIPVLVGEYMVESVVERRSIIALLVRERLKATAEFTARVRERLRNVPGQAGQCRERLHVAIQRLELLKEG
ncbi:uncharacterized protein N7515_004066 [Penicillium bovifimosum]|uniref:Uncharacterized protein n=1 Tax=Penicillium bovifimosum TaxID=126998 RepID=A0A9W9H625_9EURO|nr:uncharacterized protein N7515_004066 [Penicillium bovifimosum]KAJ5139218.1 hypothetical protein N7515_004066 [Penicillium bovifimosum]